MPAGVASAAALPLADGYLANTYFCVGDETCALADVNGDDLADAVAFVKSTAGEPMPGCPDKGDIFVALAWMNSSGATFFGPPQKWHDYMCVDDEICKLA